MKKEHVLLLQAFAYILRNANKMRSIFELVEDAVRYAESKGRGN